ncbi:hypothetical protein BG004_005796 [Podila humilis]|nr:hypothetical protein BG004_005796 [Podila humilis]
MAISKALALALSISTLTLAQGTITDPIDPNGGPGLVAASDFVFNDRALFLSDGQFIGPPDTNNNNVMSHRSLFYSLDLTTSWPTSKPAWKKLTHQKNKLKAGKMALSHDGTTVYFFENDSVQPYNIQSDEWGLNTNITATNEQEGIPFFGTDVLATTDLDSGKIFGGRFLAEGQKFILSEFDPKDNSVISSAVDVSFNATQTMVYSRSRKSLFFSTNGPKGSNLHEYNLASKTFTAVVGKGQVPEYREGACFVSTNDGKSLILAGGRRVFQPPVTADAAAATTTILKDVSIFDIETSTWTKITETPNGYYLATCAVTPAAANNNVLILYGGFDKLYPVVPHQTMHNDNIPAIFDFKTKTWLANFTPGSNNNSTSNDGGNETNNNGGSSSGSESSATLSTATASRFLNFGVLVATIILAGTSTL